MVSSQNLLPTIFSHHWPREPCTRTSNRALVFPATSRRTKARLPSLRLLMRRGSCWPCWGTSAKDSRVTKNSRALIWPLLTLLTRGHPSHSGAMQKEELDLGTFHKQEETWGDHKEGDKASEKDHRNSVGTEIRRAVQQVCCTNKCLSRDDPWTPYPGST